MHRLPQSARQWWTAWHGAALLRLQLRASAWCRRAYGDRGIGAGGCCTRSRPWSSHAHAWVCRETRASWRSAALREARTLRTATRVDAYGDDPAPREAPGLLDSLCPPTMTWRGLSQALSAAPSPARAASRPADPRRVTGCACHGVCRHNHRAVCARAGQGATDAALIPGLIRALHDLDLGVIRVGTAEVVPQR
jgi:hypothetical protein